MSRIDEALRRASAGQPFAHDADEPAKPRSADTVLDGFPRERTPAPAPRRHLAPAPAPTAPASPSPRVLRSGSAGEGRLVTGDLGSPVPVEQYRRLAASLHELQAERGVKTIMVTSAVPQEGKTLTVVNLALTLAESYARRVLLIDADLRRPGVHELLGVRGESGLSETLQGHRGDLPTVALSPHLHVLPAGKPQANPLAGLVSDAMRRLVEECEARYDWVLVDAPPVGLLTDAQLLARLTHGVVFVIRAGSTPFAAVERAISSIGRESIIGTVLNSVDERTIPSVGYYHNYSASE